VIEVAEISGILGQMAPSAHIDLAFGPHRVLLALYAS
jgi:hypothetical protein